jgi:hypothetical protein
MLSVFRSLRRKLGNDGKFKTYLFYALGEMFLVIVGILIALRINTWNDDRLLNKRILEIKADVKSELIENRTQLQIDMEAIRLTYGSCELLLNRMNEGPLTEVEGDSLVSQIMGYAIWSANTFAMDEFTSTGVYSKMKDDSLKESIIRFKVIEQDVREHAGFLDLQARALMDYVAAHGSMASTSSRLPFMNIEKSILGKNLEMYADPEFENRIILKMIALQFTLMEYMEAEAAMTDLIERL